MQWIAGVAPNLIVEDATNVHFTDDGDDSVNVAAKATGQRIVLASVHASSLAVRLGRQNGQILSSAPVV